IIEHVAAYGPVAGAFAIGYRFSPVCLLTLAIFYCGGIELFQIPLPTRHARVSDFLIDFAASAVAIALFRAGESLQETNRGQYRQVAEVTTQKQGPMSSDQRIR